MGSDPGPVEAYVRKLFRSNYMAEPMGIVTARGLSQFHMCGYGENCAAGSVVNTHGFLDEIKDYCLPSVEHEAYRQADVVAHRLGEMVSAKK